MTESKSYFYLLNISPYLYEKGEKLDFDYSQFNQTEFI